MNRYEKLGKNIGLITIGSASSKLLNFLLLPLYTNILTSGEYGISDLIFTIVGLALPFFLCVIYEPLMRFTLTDKENAQNHFCTAVFVWIIGTGIMLLCSPVVFLSELLKPYYLYIILYYLGYSTYTMLSYFIRGIEKINIYTISGIINTFSIICLNIVFLVFFRLGVRGYLLAYIISQMVSSVFLFVFGKLYKYFSVKKIFEHNYLKEMIRYSLPMVPNSISWWISNYSDKYVMLMYYPASALGIYSISYKIPSLCSVFSQIFSTAWEISAVEDFGSEESKSMFSNIYELYSTFLIVITSFLILSTKILASLLFKKDFFAAWQYVPFLLIGTAFHSLSGFLGTIFTSAKKTNNLFVSTFAGAILNIVLNLILIPKYAAFGAAFATMTSYVIVYIIRLVKSRQYLKFKIDAVNSCICLLVIIVQTFVILYTESYISLIMIVCFILILILRKKYVLALASKFIHRK